MTRFSKHKWWIMTALLTAPLVALAAGVPNVFAPNTTISSAAVNANFTNLADRITALEARKTTISLPMNDSPGPIGSTGKTATFMAGGGPLAIIVSGTAWSGNANNVMDIAVQLDGVTIGHLTGYTNELGSHKALPTRVINATAAAGSHTLGLLNGNTTTTNDGNDYFSITVVELGS
jgi:hypothetical protein